MAVHDGLRWSDLFAARTRGEGGDAIATIMALSTTTDLISFSGGFPDPATFPRGALPRIVAELVDSGDVTAFQYAPTAGVESTRDYFAGRLHEREGHRPADDELMVTSGSIDGLELLSKSFLDRDDVVVVEAPTYLGAIMAFNGFAARVESVPLDNGGLDVDALAERLREGLRPKLVYTIPDHHNPAGVTLTANRRAALVELARRYGFLVVEDVAYRELGFTGERATSLWSLAPDVVVQLNTFSKTFMPGVRLGWAVGPAPVTAQLVIAKQNTDQCAGALGQRLLESYGRAGLLDEQIAGARELYQRRCALLLDAMDCHLPASAQWTRPRGGFFSWLTLPPGLDSVVLAGRAREHKVAFVPGAPFYPDGRGHDSVRLSFSRVDDGDIDEGVRRLATLVHWVH